ncbi:MAG: hypothetical protein ACR2JQ_10340, partial [Mycobacteriales bacterium]
GALTTPPWGRAPFLLARQPIVWLALFAAAAILAGTAASGPLMLSSIETAEFHREIAHCPAAHVPTLSMFIGSSASDVTGNAAAVRQADRTARSAMSAANVAAPRLTASRIVFLPDLLSSVASDTPTLFASPGALRHVHVVRSAMRAGSAPCTPGR